MKPTKSKAIILFACLLPFLYALFLACYQWLDWFQLTDYPIHFARINSYIYAHSYGALLLVFFVGIKMGQSRPHSNDKIKHILYAALALCAWLSFSSFADRQGLIFLIFCWLLFSLSEIYFNQQLEPKNPSHRRDIKVNMTVIGLLTILVLINQ